MDGRLLPYLARSLSPQPPGEDDGRAAYRPHWRGSSAGDAWLPLRAVAAVIARSRRRGRVSVLAGAPVALPATPEG